jgi:hypothetical protein
VSAGGSCPHVAEEAQTHDRDDRHDEDFHDRSLLGAGVMTIDDGTVPALMPDSTPEVRNMQLNSGKGDKLLAWEIGAS